MATNTYTTNTGRINKFKGELIAHAIPVEVLGIAGQNKKMPRNNGDTVIYRRYLPYGATTTNANTQNRMSVSAAAHITTEGVTPNADSLTPVDVTVQLAQYACLYAVTDKVVDMYEDDVPDEMKKQVGERMGLVREMIRYGALKAGTNVFYSGGTSRATVSGKITITLLRKMARNLLANHAKPVTGILSASPNYGTSAIEASYLVFCHTDCENDIRDLPGFKHTSEYGQRKPVHEMEVGSVDRFRFIVSPELASYADAATSVTASTYGLYTTTGTNPDVYPMIVVAEDAWGDVALRGSESLDPTWIPPGQKDKVDPLGQRGYVGAKFYAAATVLNNGFMAVGEVGVTNL